MNKTIRLHLLPLGRELVVDAPADLRDLLFPHGVEFPCGGRGLCKGCRIKVLDGTLPITDDDRRKLSPGELSAGWRLACRAVAESDLKLELAQWEAPILSDDSPFAFTPHEGLGVAVDIGTTTVVAQLLDLQNAQVLAVGSALNDQAVHGADIVSRIEFAVSGNGRVILRDLIRSQIGALSERLLRDAGVDADQLSRVVLVGNTVMHHLFSGIDAAPLSVYPFEPKESGLRLFKPRELGWSLSESATVSFLPCLGGFVGSDILAGILATRLHETTHLNALVDLGTNGEIVVGNRDRLLCTSTAAGPAFEGARISMGMRAATGAISEVKVKNGGLVCHTLGNATPRGLCGSGLVDATAAGLQLGWITNRGRLTRGEHLPLAGQVTLNQRDIRELQLAKGAIAAGLKVLLNRWGASTDDLVNVFLAGAFGNYVDQESARRIGLLNVPEEKIQAAGNTALLGAKMALFSATAGDWAYAPLLAKTESVSLKEDPGFQEAYVDEMLFPDGE